MSLSHLYDGLKEAGSKVMTLIEGQPWLKTSMEYIHAHPWISLGVALGAVCVWKFMNRRRNLPPGPFNVPLLGAVSYLRADMYVKLLEVKPIYGDIIYLKALGREIVILNSMEAIREALVRRGEEFSYREESGFLKALKFPEDDIVNAPYNAEWKANKKFAMTSIRNFGFGTSKSEEKIHSGLDKLEAILQEQKGQPVSPKDHLIRYTASLVFGIFFNQDLELNDPKVTNLKDLLAAWYKDFTEGFLVYDFLPGNKWIKKLIAGGYVKRAKKGTDAILGMLKEMIQEHRADFDPTHIRDVIDHYLAHRGHLSDEKLAVNLLVTLPDGIDTASKFLSWILLYITKHQDVQEKLQQQIDDVIGRNRKPSFLDKANLPYAEAIILEALRCSDVIPMISPRDLQKDTELMGYTIPKEASVMACFHSVHHDPDFFPNPSKFDPSRFLDSNGKVIQAKASHVLTFSVGTRMCLAEQYGKNLFYFTLISVAQQFNMKFDPSQPEPSSLPDPKGGILRVPHPYKICFTPR